MGKIVEGEQRSCQRMHRISSLQKAFPYREISRASVNEQTTIYGDGVENGVMFD
jgi:hypothetical protein